MATADAVLEVIASAELSPTEHLLFKHFVEGAFDPEISAQYLASKIQLAQGDVETGLRSIKQDWRKLAKRLSTFDPVPAHLDALVRVRDDPLRKPTKRQPRVSVQLVESAYIVPPSMLHDLKLAEEGALYEILEAFLSPQYVAQLQTLLSSNAVDDSVLLQNAWLVSPSIHRAFRAGHVDVRLTSKVMKDFDIDRPESEIDGDNIKVIYTMRAKSPEKPRGLFFEDGSPFESSIRILLFSTHIDQKSELPNPFLFDVHCRFATALHLFYIEDRVALGWPQPHKEIPAPIRRVSYSLWLFVPRWVRMRCYLLLIKIGHRLYGPREVPWVQQLPFGLYIKKCIRSPQNEPNALRLAEKHTTIPAPRVVDVAEYKGATYLVMTQLYGWPLLDVWHLMSYAELDRFADDLKDCVAQLRKIPNNTPYLFGDTLGGPVVDHRIPDGRGGPFNSEEEFNAHLTSHMQCTPEDVVGKEITVRHDHRSVLTHSDFHPINLLVENGRLSGIVDWECAAYMPEYWEFTKTMQHVGGNHIFNRIFRRTFGNVYDPELVIEKKLWWYTPFGV